jgi:hypothetical protein
LIFSMASSARRSSSAASGASDPPSASDRADGERGEDVEARDPERLLQSGAERLAGAEGAGTAPSTAASPAAASGTKTGELVLADARRQVLGGEGGGQPGGQRGQDQVSALVPQRLVQATEPVEVRHHHLIGARLRQTGAGRGL